MTDHDINIDDVVRATIEIKNYNDREDFVPEFLIKTVSEKYALTTDECRIIRDTIQEIKRNK